MYDWPAIDETGLQSTRGERARALMGPRRLGYEMLYAELLGPLIEALPEVEFVPVTTALHDLRMRKDARELTLLEAASKVNSIAADAALRSAEAGMTDYDVLSVAMASLQ